jgi:predicted Zn-dependent peptidase
MAEEEISRARAQVKASMLMARESTDARCDQLGQQILIHGHPIPVEDQIAKLEAVTAGDVAQAAATIFAGAPTLAALGPVSKLESFDRLTARLPGGAPSGVLH